MQPRRGLVPLGITASTICLVACSIAWGALGVVALVPTVTLDSELYRYLTTLLATMTVCLSMVNLTARIIRAIRAAEPATQTDDGYAAGYADGLDARPGLAPVSPARGLVRTPR